jgi:tetratricopeptide (TPR) repeat protein
MFAALLIMAAALGQQSDDIHQRLLLVLGPEADQRAETLMQEKRFADVEAMVKASAASKQEILALEGCLEFLGGQAQSAAQYLVQAHQMGELRESDRFTLSMAWVRAGNDEDARKELLSLAAQQPGKSLYEYWLGRIDYDQRRYAEAVEHLKTATHLEPASARAWDSLGLAYDMQGQTEEALKAFAEAVRRNRAAPHGTAWPPNDLGSLLLRAGETKKAEAALREALEFDPQMPEAHYHLGRALEKDGANEEAVTQYLAAVQGDKNATEACYSLAQLYRKMGKEQESAEMFSEWRKRRDAAR